MIKKKVTQEEFDRILKKETVKIIRSYKIVKFGKKTMWQRMSKWDVAIAIAATICFNLLGLIGWYIWWSYWHKDDE